MLPDRDDTASCARLLAAFHGDRWANSGDRALRDRLEELAPGCGELIREARAWHQRAAMWSLGRGCGGGVICGAGLPAVPETYRAPSGQVLPGRWVLADPDEHVTAVNRSVPGADPSGRVTAVRGSAADPADILSRPEVRAIEARLSAHSHMGAQFWEPGMAEAAVAEWGRLVPPGSVFCMSLWLADRSTGAGREFAAAFGGDGVHAHSAADVRRWFGGMTVEGLTVRRCAAGAVAMAAATVP